MLEVARAFGMMLKMGWQPERTIILASWDGEEYGLLGSTAWADANADMIFKQAVAYLNVDVAVCGPIFLASATHSLDHLIRTVATEVTDPYSGKTIFQVWDKQITDLGSGSDYTAFLDHYGIAASDLIFGGPYGVYHSEYDDIYWMSHFGDPTYQYHKACAIFWGLMAIKLADSEIVPFNYTFSAGFLDVYHSRIVALLKQLDYNMDLSELRDAENQFTMAAWEVDREMKSPSPDPSLNDRLIFAERSFLSSDGLPRRPYYKHVIQAPGLYEGYAPSTYPGLTQALNARNWEMAQTQYKELCRRIRAAANALTMK